MSHRVRKAMGSGGGVVETDETYVGSRDEVLFPEKPKMTQEEQSALFIERARALGVDETGREVEELFSKAAPIRQTPRGQR